MLPVISEINPKTGGSKAPPTIDITIKEDPIFVLCPRPSIPIEKIVGNMILMKKAIATKVYTTIIPVPNMANRVKQILMMV
jgi:hypothetical protein